MNLPEFFGLDIGSSAIRVAQVKYNSFNKAEILNLGQVQLEDAIQDLKNPAVKQQIIDKIIAVKESSGIKINKVVAALPEAMIFNKVTSVPNLPEEELEQMLYYELKNHIPVNPNEVKMDYIPLGPDKENPKLLKILLIAAPKNLVESYMAILTGAKLEPLALETETVAIARIMGKALDSDKPLLVADVGHKGVDICLLKGGKILFSQSIGTGSESITKAIAMDLGVDSQQAEQYKIKFGLLPDQAEGRVARSSIPILNIITNEINKLLNYFRTTSPEDVPKEIYLIGEGAKLQGIESYITENVALPCSKYDAVQKLNMPDKYKSEYAQLTTIGFTLAVGLAMKTE